MNIAVTATGNTLDDQVDPRFGRCPCFLVVDSETLHVTALENANATAGGGAGIQSAQLMAQHNVDVVLTGNCGPNAFKTLEAADIQVVVGIDGSARDAVQRYKTGELAATTKANVTSHFGTGGARTTPAGGNTEETVSRPASPSLSATPQGAAGAGDVTRLKLEIQELRRKLDDVKARLDELEQ